MRAVSAVGHPHGAEARPRCPADRVRRGIRRPMTTFSVGSTRATVPSPELTTHTTPPPTATAVGKRPVRTGRPEHPVRHGVDARDRPRVPRWSPKRHRGRRRRRPRRHRSGSARPTAPGISGFRCVTLPSTALAVHTEPMAVATRSGDSSPSRCTTGAARQRAAVHRPRRGRRARSRSTPVEPSTATSTGSRRPAAVVRCAPSSPSSPSRVRSTTAAGPTSTRERGRGRRRRGRASWAPPGSRRVPGTRVGRTERVQAGVARLEARVRPAWVSRCKRGAQR